MNDTQVLRIHEKKKIGWIDIAGRLYLVKAVLSGLGPPHLPDASY